MQAANDSDIVNKIRNGDSSSFEQVFKLYSEALLRYAFTMLKDESDAQDIVQQLFVGLWVKRAQLPNTNSLKSYLYKGVYNGCLNKIKQQQVRTNYAKDAEFVMDYQSVAASQLIENKEVSNAIAAAIEELPEQCRLIFKKSKVEQLKYQEIADELGLSIKTVENQMGKALKFLRMKLKNYLPLCLLFILLNG